MYPPEAFAEFRRVTAPAWNLYQRGIIQRYTYDWIIRPAQSELEKADHDKSRRIRESFTRP